MPRTPPTSPPQSMHDRNIRSWAKPYAQLAGGPLRVRRASPPSRKPSSMRHSETPVFSYYGDGGPILISCCQKSCHELSCHSILGLSTTSKNHVLSMRMEFMGGTGVNLGELVLGSDRTTITAATSGLAIARVKYTVKADGWRLESPLSLAGTTSFPIHLKATGADRDTDGEEVAIFQRGNGEFRGPDIVNPLLAGLLSKQSRARAEIDAGENLQEISLTCIFIPAIMPGQLVEVHDAMMGRSWRGKVTSVGHEVNGVVLTTALELIRHVSY